MKKLLRYHISQVYHPSVLYILGFYLLTITFDVTLNQMGMKTFASFILSSGLIGGFSMMLLFNIYDFHGEQSTFIQTLPYERKTILFSKWVFQVLMVASVILFIFLSQIAIFEQSELLSLTSGFYDQGISMGLLITTFYAILVMMFIVFTDAGQLIILSVKKVQRLVTRLLMIIPSVLLVASIIIFYVWGFSELTNFTMLAIYTILGPVAMSLVIKGCSYLIYKKLDIHGAGSQQVQFASLYGGR